MKLSNWSSAIAAALVLGACTDPQPITGPGAAEHDGRLSADFTSSASPLVTLRSASAAYTFAITWRFYGGAACTGSPGSVFAFPAVSSTGVSFTPTSWASMEVTAAAVSSTGAEFSGWTVSDGTASASPTICIPAPVDVVIYTAAYGQAANTPPELGALGSPETAEGSLLEFTATATDSETPVSGLTFSLSPEAPTGASITAGGAFSWTPSESDGPGTHTFNVCVHDDGVPALSDCEPVTVSVTEVNQAPALAAIAPQLVQVGGTVIFTAIATDADLPANTLTFNLSGAPTGASIDPVTGEFSWMPATVGTYVFDVDVTDDGTPPASDSRQVEITVEEASAPEISGLEPEDGSVFTSGGPVDFTGTFTAPGSANQGVCEAVAESTGGSVVSGTQGNGTGECTSTITFSEAGMYLVSYTVTDLNGMSDTATTDIVVYDPAAGRVTANGWFVSGPGALAHDESLAGRAVFNFNSRYHGAAAEPTGFVAFQLHDAGLNFRGLNQEWLVVDDGAETAAFRGMGTLEGEPGAFGYLVELSYDGSPDLIRVRIWRGSDESELVYDSGPHVAIGGGTLNLHDAGAK